MENNNILIGKGNNKKILVYNEEINSVFEQELKRLISSLINKGQGEEYKKTPDKTTCQNCDFAILCNK